MMAPFIVNSRKNGLMMPEGYWAQHRPEPLTEEDYNSVRWVAKPANLLDNDLPIQAAAAYLITTADRAKDMKQKPVYILGHAGAGGSGRATLRRGQVPQHHRNARRSPSQHGLDRPQDPRSRRDSRLRYQL